MATFTKIALSGSTNGRGIKVAATASTGTTIHATGTDQDEIWLYAYNSDSVSRLLTIQFGGTSTPDDDIKVTIPSQQGLMLVVPGLVLTGSVTVAAYGSAANVITVQGFVNRIS